jgi:hypothetical protein
MNAIFILMILGWFFVPVYLSSGIYTMPEYLRLRSALCSLHFLYIHNKMYKA